MRIRVLIFAAVSLGANANSKCGASVNEMLLDPNFILVNNTLYETCYVQYQNDVYAGISGKTLCTPWEYNRFCTGQNIGRSCIVSNSFLDMSLCVPSDCGDSDLDMVNDMIFQANSTTSIDCTPSPVSPLVPVLVSTGVVLALTVFLVFALRPPKYIREERRTGKGKKLISSTSVQFN